MANEPLLGARNISSQLNSVEGLPPEVTVVMPCLNEADTLEICIEKAQHAFREHGIRGEIIVADNGSMDGSIDIAVRMGARVVSVEAKIRKTRPRFGRALWKRPGES